MDDITTNELQTLVADIFNKLSPDQHITTVESCTGGLIAGAITDVPGSSKHFNRGFITYSNQAKTDLVGVPANILNTYGAVSEQCAQAMADGALKTAKSDYAIAVTGIAGPGGATPGKPTGLVYIGLAQKNGKTQVWRNVFEGDRTAVRMATVKTALTKLHNALHK